MVVTASDIGPEAVARYGADAYLAKPFDIEQALDTIRRLVHPDWLSAVLAGERPEAAPDGPVLLFHVNFGVPEEYAENHLPGALYLDTNWLEDPVDWNRRSPAELSTRSPRRVAARARSTSPAPKRCVPA